jgi:dCMP deaminase
MTQEKLDKWDNRFLDLAKFIAQWSKDPSTQVGCVIVDSMKRIVATGFNGLPAGVDDTVERLSNRDIKYEMVVHAERNAIIDAKRDLSGMSIYVWPIMPCSVCASMIIQAGLTRVIAPRTNNQRLIEACNFHLTEEMFAETGIALCQVAPEDLTDASSET